MMDKERFEELIIDYLDNNITGMEKEDFELALGNSEECRDLFEHYKSIRTITKTDNDVSPGKEVLDRISEHVEQSERKDKKSFSERWFKFPVLAPALAAVIIAMLWFSAGEEYLKNKNIIPASDNTASQEFRSDYKAKAEKLNRNRVVMEEGASRSKEVDNIELYDSEEKSESGVSLPAPSDVADDVKGEKEIKKSVSGSFEVKDKRDSFAQEQEETTYFSKGRNTPEAQVNNDIASAKKESFADEDILSAKPSGVEDSGKDLMVSGSEVMESNREMLRTNESDDISEARVSSTIAPITPAKRVETMNGYRNELNEIVTMQYKGDCRESLERSQQLLDATPEPSVSIKTDLYVTQGECFMELKQYDKALEVYNKAKELTPHKSHLFNAKIKEVYLKQAK